MPDELEAKAIQVSENAKALLRELGWTNEQIEAVLQRPARQCPPQKGLMMRA